MTGRKERPVGSGAGAPGRRAVCFGLGALAATMALPRAPRAGVARRSGDVVGRLRVRVARHADTLLDIARAEDLGYTELVAANPGVDPWIPGEGTRVILPTAHVLPNAPRVGLVLNLGDQRLYHFDGKGDFLESMPLGIGAEGWQTPLGSTKVTRKVEGPAWYVPKSIRAERPDLPSVVPPGPDNPLGSHALYLGWPSYLIHGTNKPDGVGRRVSHGCIRLYPEDIARLFAEVRIGTRVTVVDEPVKIGWSHGMLMLEAHPNQEQADAIEFGRPFEPARVPELEFRVAEAAGDRADFIDWPRARRVVRARRGVPTPILRGPASAASDT